MAMLDRRRALAVLGGGVILAAAGGARWAATRTPEAALAPWAAAPAADPDPRRRALSWAILAPNPHNRQPWTVALEREGVATLYCDLDRRLPATDPHDRQIAIGLGCFLELMSMAAAADGFAADVALFPEGAPEPPARLDARPVARVRFRPDAAAAADPLFAHAAARRTVKEPFADAPVADAAVAAMRAAARETRFAETREATGVARIGALAQRAWDVEAATPAAFRESVELMRIGRAEIEANPDGIDIGGPAMEALAAAGLLTRETLADPRSIAARQGAAMYAGMIASARGWLWLTTPDDSRASQIAAGRDWMRIALAATGAGLALHPMSQALQEFPEMAGPFAEAHALLDAPAPSRVQMLARFGHGPETPPSPRWPHETRIRPA